MHIPGHRVRGEVPRFSPVRSTLRSLVIVTVSLLVVSPTFLSILGDAASHGAGVSDLVVRPSARADHAMAYDGQSDRIILFGGHTAGGPNGETWAYDLNSNAWTNMQPSPSPPARANHAMAYDARSDRVILFGGWPGFGDTWAYDFKNNTWTNKAPSAAPLTRWDHRMAYDAQSDRVILYAGHDSSGGSDIQYSDTWAYDYNTNGWSNLNPSATPSGIGQYDLTYDTASDRIIHFGGRVPSLIGSNGTWSYDITANSWTDRNPSLRPPARMEHAMAYDAVSDQVIMFGGAAGTVGGGIGPIFSDTWTYDFNANRWTKMDPPASPSGRQAHRMAYDAESDRVVMFGGSSSSLEQDASSYNNEAWAYDYHTNTWTYLTPPLRGEPGLSPLVVFASVAVVLAAAGTAVVIFLRRRRKR